MPTTRNGWPTIDDTDCEPLIVAGVPFVRGVRKGDVAVIMRWVATQYHYRVEDLQSPGCWGYNAKYIRKTNVPSEHWAGNAIDVNAPRHNEGHAPTSALGGFTYAQMNECLEIERESQGTVRWGGHFNDGMHWEIIGNATQVHQFADKLREEDDMPSVQEIWDIHEGRGDRRETGWSKLKYVDATVEQLLSEVDDLRTEMTDVKATLNNILSAVQAMTLK